MNAYINTSYDILMIKRLRLQRCLACFSRDRNLFPLRETSLVASLCPEFDVSVPEHRICWQCTATLRKIMKFRKTTMISQDLFRRAVDGDVVRPKGIACLTKTKAVIHSMVPNKIISNNISEEAAIWVNQEIKQETQVDIKLEEDLTEFCQEAAQVDESSCSSPKAAASKQAFKPIIRSEAAKKSVTISSSNQDQNHLIVTREQNDYKITEVMEITPGVFVTYDDRMCTVKTFSEEEMLAYRERKKNEGVFKKSAIKCEKCVRNFRSQIKYDEHMAAHDVAAGDFECDICNLRFRIKLKMTEHHNSHYQCYSCVACSYQTTSLQTMTQHYDHTHFVTHRKCNECDATFKTSRDYKWHKKYEHTQEEGSASEQNSQAMRNKRKLPILQCEVCNKKYMGTSRLRCHLKQVHCIQVNEPSYCAECDIHFKTRFLYRHHLSTSLKHNKHEDFKHKCEKCGKAFANIHTLKRHDESMHLKPLDHKCDACGRTYNGKIQLRRHVRRKHEGKELERNILCDQCGKGFHSKRLLAFHINTHTGARPFVCQDCGADFGFPSALYTHRRLKHKVKRLREREADASTEPK